MSFGDRGMVNLVYDGSIRTPPRTLVVISMWEYGTSDHKGISSVQIDEPGTVLVPNSNVMGSNNINISGKTGSNFSIHVPG